MSEYGILTVMVRVSNYKHGRMNMTANKSQVEPLLNQMMHTKYLVLHLLLHGCYLRIKSGQIIICHFETRSNAILEFRNRRHASCCCLNIKRNFPRKALHLTRTKVLDQISPLSASPKLIRRYANVYIQK